MNTSVEHRLRRLRAGRPHFALLALDHGLTYGTTVESSSLPLYKLLEACGPYIGGFVATYGIARTLNQWPVGVSLVLQCFGAPQHVSRRQIATIDNAMFLDAAAVSVQINLSDDKLEERIPEISAFTTDAHSAGMPVLFMIAGQHKSSELSRSVRICQELGADLVKVNCTEDQFLSTDVTVEACLREGPPVLMAGGNPTGDLAEMGVNAVKMGLSGYCVGRHIFRSPAPEAVVAQLDTIFSNVTNRSQK